MFKKQFFRLGRIVTLTCLFLMVVQLSAQTIKGKAEDGDQFGRALAVGDFNGDSFQDLAIGVPMEDLGPENGIENAGLVHIIYGTADGLAAQGAVANQIWYQGKIKLPSLQQQNLMVDQQKDWFGASLAVGRFNNDSYDDLAIGIPGKSVNNNKFAGAVVVIYGSAQGLVSGDGLLSNLFTQGVPLINPFMQGAAQKWDYFGSSLCTGDFDGNGYDDLAIGTPGETINGEANVGAINVVYSNNNGLNPTAPILNQMFSQKTAGLNATPEKGDAFGWSLASGYFDDSYFSPQYCDLAIGVPFENDESMGLANVGVVHVLRGAAHGLTVNNSETISLKDISPGGWKDDYFGYSLAAGAFDVLTNYPYPTEDLAIGIPGREMTYIPAGYPNAGKVLVLYNWFGGGWEKKYELFHQQENSYGGAEPDDFFGIALASNKKYFGSGQRAPGLVIGTPFEDLENSNQRDVGLVNVLHYTIDGLTDQYNEWHDQSGEKNGQVESGDRFGAALAIGNFNDDDYADLAIGVPLEDIESVHATDAGAVNIFYGTPSGLFGNRQFWYQGGGGLLKSAQSLSAVSKQALNFHLFDNYPNPFNPETQITYQLPEVSHITIKIFNVLGQEVITLADGEQEAGKYRISWNGKNTFGASVPSGTYFCRMSSVGTDTKKQFTAYQKMLLLR